MIDVILSGLGAIANVSTILQYLESESDDDAVQESLMRVEQRVAEINGLLEQGETSQRMLQTYNALVTLLQHDPYYSGRLSFRPTEHGTWLVIARRSTILRDPHGEY
jgi:hypothetical protein